jgi:glycerophosphoryl diester phosphodiesterase
MPDLRNAKPEIMIAAHRGASYAAPENTIPAFKLAFKENADFIEGDFRLTKDNEIVCIHDPNTKRITKEKNKLNIRSSVLSELKKLDVGIWKGDEYKGSAIPTIQEVLRIIPKGKGIIIEIKDNREIFIKKLVEILKFSPVPGNKIRIIAFKPGTVRLVKKYIPEIKVYLLFGWYFSRKKYLISFVQRRLKNSLKTLVCDGVDLKAAPYIDSKLVSYLRRNKLDFCTYNVDAKKDLEMLMNLGVDIITTNSPDKMRKIIASLSKL